MKTILRDFLSSLLSENWVDASLLPITLIIITLTAILAYLFCHSVISVIVKTATRRTKSDWDDDILNERFLKAFSQLAPAIVVAYLLPDAFDNESKMYVWFTKLTEFYIVWAFVHLANQLLQNLYDAFDKRQKYKIHTLRGVFQILVEIFNVVVLHIDYQRVTNDYFQPGNNTVTPEVFYRHFPECIGTWRMTG